MGNKMMDLFVWLPAERPQGGIFATPVKIRSLVLCALMLTISVSLAVPAEFQVTDTNGNVHTLEKYLGKWVLVNFWATWCPPNTVRLK